MNALTLAGAPYVAIVYTVALVYSAYSLVNNAWSLYDELYNTDHSDIQSIGEVDTQIEEI